MSTSIAILAGGRSQRMGTDKSFVLCNGIPLIEHVIARVKPLSLPIIVITNKPQAYEYLKLPVYTDILPDKGSLGGMWSALTYSQTEYTLCVACDMPFLNPSLLQFMQSQLQDYEALVPLKGGIPQCFHAFYSQNCLPILERQLHLEQLKVNLVYHLLKTRFLDEQDYQLYDEEGLSFYNVNTSADLAEAQEIMNQPAYLPSAKRRPPA